MRFINSGNINRRNVNKFKTSHSTDKKTCLFVSYIVYYVLIFMTIRLQPYTYGKSKRENKIWWNYNYFSYFTLRQIIMLFILPRKKYNPTSAVLIEVYWKRNDNEVQNGEREKTCGLTHLDCRLSDLMRLEWTLQTA